MPCCPRRPARIMDTLSKIRQDLCLDPYRERANGQARFHWKSCLRNIMGGSLTRKRWATAGCRFLLADFESAKGPGLGMWLPRQNDFLHVFLIFLPENVAPFLPKAFASGSSK